MDPVKQQHDSGLVLEGGVHGFLQRVFFPSYVYVPKVTLKRMYIP